MRHSKRSGNIARASLLVYPCPDAHNELTTPSSFNFTARLARGGERTTRLQVDNLKFQLHQHGQSQRLDGEYVARTGLESPAYVMIGDTAVKTFPLSVGREGWMNNFATVALDIHKIRTVNQKLAKLYSVILEKKLCLNLKWVNFVESFAIEECRVLSGKDGIANHRTALFSIHDLFRNSQLPLEGADKLIKFCDYLTPHAKNFEVTGKGYYCDRLQERDWALSGGRTLAVFTGGLPGAAGIWTCR